VKEFSQWEAQSRIAAVVAPQGLKMFKNMVKYDEFGNKLVMRGSGLRLSPHKNTWKRKRDTSYLVRIEYFLDGQKLLHHVEPWASYPSEYLIARLMLLPIEEST
jgi:hypothetical protein